jgi:Mannosyltransferase putative
MRDLNRMPPAMLLLLLVGTTVFLTADCAQQCSAEHQPPFALEPGCDENMLHVLQAVSTRKLTVQAATTLLQDVLALRHELANPASAAAARVAERTTAAARPRRHARGIVMPVGNQDQWRSSLVTLRALWSPPVSSTLPVEMIHYGAKELYAPAAAAAEALAAASGTHLKIIDGAAAAAAAGAPPLMRRHSSGVHDMHIGFAAKAHALAFVTSFSEALLLDTDNIPLTDPAALFDAPAYTEAGVLLWPDFWTDMWMQRAIYSLLGLTAPWITDASAKQDTPSAKQDAPSAKQDTPSAKQDAPSPAPPRAVESGQLLLHRGRHAAALEWSWLLNTHSASGSSAEGGGGAVGACLWGDKDLWPIALTLQAGGRARVAGASAVLPPPLQALSIGEERRGGGTLLEHAGMLQRAPDGSLAFLHRTAAGKLFPHCAARRAYGDAQACVIVGALAPPDQPRLLAAVEDPTGMTFKLEDLDVDWQMTHCASSGRAAGVFWDTLGCDVDAAPAAGALAYIDAHRLLPAKATAVIAAADAAAVELAAL